MAEPPGAKPPSQPKTRIALAAVCGLGVAGLIALALLRDRVEETPAETGAAAASATAAVAPAAPAVPPAALAVERPLQAPSLDLTRVAPDGAALLAGRAAPHAEIAVRAGDQVLATTRADATGAFVATFDLAPGAPGAVTVTAAQAEAPGAPGAELAVVLPAPEGGFAPTSAPGPAEASAETAPPRAAALPAAPPVAPEPPRVAAVAPAREPAAAPTPDAGPAPAPEPPSPSAVAPVIALAPAPRPEGPGGPRRGETVVVAPGATLWSLARERYGAGRRYPVIVAANPGEIDDPALIFPGQRLVLPAPAD